MSTAGNPHTEGVPGRSEGNALTEEREVETTVTNPTLSNGDGTYDVSVSDVRVLESSDDVLGVSWDSTHKTSVDSVSGNTVSVLFESPDGVDSLANESDGQINGTLTVRVRQ